MLPVKINGEDRDVATSTESLTLLQLLQGIDLASTSLPPELLQTRANATVLRRLCIEAPGPAFVLCVNGAEGAFGTRVPIDSAFEGLALAMRYSCPIEIEASLLEGEALDEEACRVRFPRAFTRAEAAKISSDITRRMAGLGEGTVPSEDAPLAVDAFDPASLTVEAAPAAPSPELNANAPPPGMLKRALAIAREKGDQAAVEKIEKAISEASTME